MNPGTASAQTQGPSVIPPLFDPHARPVMPPDGLNPLDYVGLHYDISMYDNSVSRLPAEPPKWRDCQRNAETAA